MKKILFVLTAVLVYTSSVKATIRLPRLVSDGMILQRDKPIKIWGWAEAGEKVTVSFKSEKQTVETGANGSWSMLLKAMPVGGPYQMTIEGSNRIVLKNILLGDVWVCSGQSNMELTMQVIRTKYEADIKASANSKIRQFFVATKYDFKTPQGDFTKGSWEEANPNSVLRFSAAAYFFAKNLFEKYHVPIGLISVSVGGTPAESWMSEDALQEFPHLLKIAAQFKDDRYLQSVTDRNSQSAKTWFDSLAVSDLGKRPSPWYNPTYDTNSWKLMQMPAFWEDEGLKNLDGVVWFKKEIMLPEKFAGKPAQLLLGSMADADSTYLNGILIGTTSQKYSARNYSIPPGLLQAGKNNLVVRLINTNNSGGFVKDKPYQINMMGMTVDLKGDWHYRVGVSMKPIPSQTVIKYMPLGLYNGMIAPLHRYQIKGFIWYQGEANAIRAAEYRKLFPALINNWRQKWQDNKLPFLYVQLPNYLKIKELPAESKWAELREAQLQTLSLPHTGMAVTIDIGEWNDIHPLNKADVGKRLALVAQNVAYHNNSAVLLSPTYKSMQIKGNKITISFNHTDGSLALKNNQALKIAVAGADKKFVWASYQIHGDRLTVWSDKIPQPLAVRYAWADNPQGANLISKVGLPASPFRTDEWVADQTTKVDNIKEDVIQRYKTFLISSKYQNTIDLDVLLRNIDQDGKWKDLDYEDANPAKWVTALHLDRLRQLCLAYNNPKSSHFQQTSLKAAIDVTLDHWIRKRYQNKNWWQNEIGVPQYMRDIIYLMYGKLSINQLNDALEVLNQSKVRGEGANLTWSADLKLHHSLLTGDQKVAQECMALLINEIKITNLDGIQPDYSYHQHGPRLQIYHYGNSYLNTNVRLAWEFQNTSMAFPKEKIEIINLFVINGWQWMSRGVNTVPGTLDRSVSRKNMLHDADIKSTLGMLSELSPEYKDSFAKIRAGQEMVTPSVIGYKYFPRSDFSVSHTPDFSFFLKTLSSRTLTTENINKENIKGRLLNSGDAYLIKDGNEYFNLMPCWDWDKLPGITNFKGKGTIEKKTFNGSVSDGKSGLSAMDYELKDHDKRVSARKVWINHGGLVVCLLGGFKIANISDSLFTVLDQSRWRGKVTVNQPGHSLKAGVSHLKNVSWLHHSGFAYIPLSPVQMTVKLEKVTGSWRSINNAEPTDSVTENVFLAQINHLPNHDGAALGYILASCSSPEATSLLASNKPFRVLSNTLSNQVVVYRDNSVFGAFFKSGNLKINGDLLSVSLPCLISITSEGIHLSDPTHSGGPIKVVYKKRSYTQTLPSDGTSVKVD